MADIELVIKIPEEVKIAVTRMGLIRIQVEMQKIIDRAIQRSTPLPKGHGRLIDADDLFDNTCIDEIPTIIEADKESNAE